jgi:hypothetical protein
MEQLTAACELFARHVTRTALDIGDFDVCKKQLIERGEKFEMQVGHAFRYGTRLRMLERHGFLHVCAHVHAVGVCGWLSRCCASFLASVLHGH